MPDLERIKQNTPGTISYQWSEDGVNVDPGTVTVTLTRSDGTALITSAATNGTGTGPRTYNVTTALTAQLDIIAVTWNTTAKGSDTTYLEVVGGFLFSLPQARALKPLDSVANYPTASLIDTRTTVEMELEDACGRAFVPRYTREALNGTGGGGLQLTWPHVRAIRSVSIVSSGVATPLTTQDLGLLTFDSLAGILYGYTWPLGFGNVIVGYEHGDQWLDRGATRNALILAKMWLVGQRNPIDDRAITFNTTDGGTYSLAVPGRNGSTFGHPDVDSFVTRKSLFVPVA